MADKYTYFTYRFLYYIQIYNIYTWIEWNFIVLTVMWKRFIVELHYSRAQRNIITLSWYSGFLSSLYYISFSVMMLKRRGARYDIVTGHFEVHGETIGPAETINANHEFITGQRALRDEYIYVRNVKFCSVIFRLWYMYIFVYVYMYNNNIISFLLLFPLNYVYRWVLQM